MKIQGMLRWYCAITLVGLTAIGCAGEVIVEGCSTTSSGSTGSGACPTGYVDQGGSCVDVAASLNGLRWELPCTDSHSGPGCDTLSAPVSTATTLGGASGTTYDVVLRFRGVIEQRTYSGGTQDGYWYVGGDTPDRADPFDIYSLSISSPPQQYYVNAGTSFQNNCFSVDYTETVQMDAGAWVTLTADPVEGTEISNRDPNGAPLVVPGIAPAPAAYDGQFLQVDVVSTTPHAG